MTKFGYVDVWPCALRRFRMVFMSKQILIVVTNVAEYPTVGFRTGLWLGELVHFVDVAEEAGFALRIASPQGGFVPIDPESLIFTDASHAVGIEYSIFKRYQDRSFMNLLSQSSALSEIDVAAYDGIYMTGGHGVMFDYPNALGELTARFYETGKIVSAVCHGPAGLLEVKLKDGQYLLKGKKATGFSWKEEELAKREGAVPYNLEEELGKRGADYSKALVPFASHVVQDYCVPLEGVDKLSTRNLPR